MGANGVGKSTVLKIATGSLKPQQGRVIIPESAIYCRQRTDNAPGRLYDLVHAINGDAFRIRGQLGIEDDWMWNRYALSIIKDTSLQFRNP